MQRRKNGAAHVGLNRRSLLVGATALGASAACGGTRADVRKTMAGAGFSKEGLERMHAVMAAHVERGDLPGVVTLLSRGDEFHADAMGTLAFGGTAPMRRDTLFRIASLTKPITGAATMMLVEDGKLRLDEPVDRLLPELAHRQVLKRLDGPLDDTVPANRPILVSDLLTLRMGMGAIFTQAPYPILQAMTEKGVAVGPSLPKAPSPDAWIRALGSLPLMHQPGEAWMYDTGLTVLGVLLARAAGKSLGDFFQERIFEPLGMKDSGFSVPAGKLDRLATAYWRNPVTGRFDVFDAAGPESQFSRPQGFPSASGGLVSTADDYLAFARMMLNKGEHGGRRLLSERSIELMTTDHITPQQKAVSPFGPGFWDKRGWGYALSIVHKHEPGDPRGLGWDGGYGTSCYWDPQTGVVGVLMTQRMMDSPAAPAAFVDFWRSAYEAVQG
ncbi:CubicO group peptidase (beta-lactamase class C family) [Archangium gephyra]|uniref:Beta-lactamase class C and other penicillin binding protein n=1 Tax=Archangium gephyra TaxID=48 RepID=A0AAC8QA25_9BACT|nr:serine hydrolase domain-containing protein [Archangium gephyra]AKJ03798.1 Beta-lactamase class C and other penicillin binding protein [Archangium gephyra]REG23577.1 CubicO group peptidase (beta-lactamase class C family) [Archangium gephyra]